MKVKIGSVNAMYPVLTVILGTMVKNKPNFTTVTHVGIMDLHTLSISVRKEHYCNLGLTEHNSFGISIPSVDMIREVDLCGNISGRDFDKSANFEVFYGTLRTAPLIKGCNVNMECVVTHTIELPSYNVYVGKIVMTHADSGLLTANNKIDLGKVQPILFSMQDYGYWNLNMRFSDAGFPFKSIVNNDIQTERNNIKDGK
jgi:flavin reductase (DIM6/NTAB) family NADH-FMN oxidoreductase RutF